jgi:hypothetical protein
MRLPAALRKIYFQITLLTVFVKPFRGEWTEQLLVIVFKHAIFHDIESVFDILKQFFVTPFSDPDTEHFYFFWD